MIHILSGYMVEAFFKFFRPLFKKILLHVTCKNRINLKLILLILLAVGLSYVMCMMMNLGCDRRITNPVHIVKKTQNVCDFRFVDEIDPWDDAITPFIIEKENFVSCPPDDSVAEHGIKSYLNIETGVVHVETKRSKRVTCYYSTFKRGGDDSVVISKEKELFLDENQDESEWQHYELNMITLQTDFLKISCGYGFRYGVYSQAYSFPTIAFNSNQKNVKSKKTMKTRKKKATIQDSRSKQAQRYSVFILVIESMSRINFNRFLNLTSEAIEEKVRSGETTFCNLKGLSKHADNSFPNMIALLANEDYRNLDSKIADDGPYDSLDFIWKRFNASGYKTSFLEESPWFTLFNYNSKGFVHQPTDYYPRPFWIVVKNRFKPFPYDVCYGSEPKVEILLRQGKSFHLQGKMNKIPTFTFLMSIEVNHNDFNELKNMDKHLSSFIQNFDYENTVFILMGDHGNRFGPSLETRIGWTDERMPFFGIFLPKSLTEPYPSIVENLKANEYSLTTWFDIHSMLQDVADNNFTQISRNQKNSATFSPWREKIPATRTCEEARIPSSYCVCDQLEPVVIDDKEADSIGHLFVDHINDKLKSVENVCQNLRLKEVQSTWGNVDQFDHEGIQYLEVTISVEPSGGIFRAIFRRTRQGMELKGEITRINAYGNQSSCLEKRSLKPFCYCYTHNNTSSES